MSEVHEKVDPIFRGGFDSANDLEEALEKLERGEYSLVITDYHLGDDAPSGGLDVINSARKKGIDSILMSREYHGEEAITAGAVGFVFKKLFLDTYGKRN